MSLRTLSPKPWLGRVYWLCQTVPLPSQVHSSLSSNLSMPWRLTFVYCDLALWSLILDHAHHWGNPGRVEGRRKVRLGIYFSTLSLLNLRHWHSPVQGSHFCGWPLLPATPLPVPPALIVPSGLEGGKNHPHTLVPGDSNIPPLIHFNPAHTSIK